MATKIKPVGKPRKLTQKKAARVERRKSPTAKARRSMVEKVIMVMADDLCIMDSSELNSKSALADFGYDAVGLFSLRMALESKFDIHISEAAMLSWKTVSDVATHCRKRQNAPIPKVD